MELALLSHCPTCTVGLRCWEWGWAGDPSPSGEGPAMALPSLCPFLGSPSPRGLRMGPFHCDTRSPLRAGAAACAGAGQDPCSLPCAQGHPTIGVTPSLQPGQPPWVLQHRGPLSSAGSHRAPPDGGSGAGGAVGSRQSPWGPSPEPPLTGQPPAPPCTAPGTRFLAAPCHAGWREGPSTPLPCKVQGAGLCLHPQRSRLRRAHTSLCRAEPCRAKPCRATRPGVHGQRGAHCPRRSAAAAERCSSLSLLPAHAGAGAGPQAHAGMLPHRLFLPRACREWQRTYFK